MCFLIRSLPEKGKEMPNFLIVALLRKTASGKWWWLKGGKKEEVPYPHFHLLPCIFAKPKVVHLGYPLTFEPNQPTNRPALTQENSIMPFGFRGESAGEKTLVIMGRWEKWMVFLRRGILKTFFALFFKRETGMCLDQVFFGAKAGRRKLFWAKKSRFFTQNWVGKSGRVKVFSPPPFFSLTFWRTLDKRK